VLAKDCGEIHRYDSIPELIRNLEAIDIENGEYEAWDAGGHVVQLLAEGIGVFKAGKIVVTATTKVEDSKRFAEIRNRAS
jgi:hypothetical protein